MDCRVAEPVLSAAEGLLAMTKGSEGERTVPTQVGQEGRGWSPTLLSHER
jgi:hypothetical protein